MNKMEDLYPLILEAFEKDLTFTFPIHGTSMQPLLKTGDLVTLSEIKSPLKKGDIILYKRMDNSFVLHRIRKIENNSYTLVGDHQVPLEKGVLKDRIIGVVIAYQKKDKVYTMKNFKYKLYKIIVRIGLFRKIFGRFF